jgi:hypothetical protein
MIDDFRERSIEVKDDSGDIGMVAQERDEVVTLLCNLRRGSRQFGRLLQADPRRRSCP